jgi:hypothetical protein
MSGNQATLPLAGSIFKFQQHGQSGAWLSELLPHTARVPTTSVSSRRCIPRRSITTRRSRSSRPGRRSPGGRRSVRGSATAWARPTRICPRFASWSPRTRGGQPLYARLWGSGFLAGRASGRPVPPGRDPGAVPDQPAGHLAGQPPPDAGPLAAVAPTAVRAHAGPGRRGTDRAIRDGLPHADVDARGDRPVGRARTHPRAVRAGQPQSRAPLPPIVCWPAGWPNATCGSSSCFTRTGTTTAACRAASAAVQPDRSAVRRLIQDLKQRGMLDDTLIVWGGEFGRTATAKAS